MPYAVNGTVSTEQLPGAIEISEAQYLAALGAIDVGKVISIDNGFELIDPPAPPAPEQPEEPEPLAYYVISKMTPWLRMTDQEAETMTAVMDAAPARLRAIYNAAPYLQSNDPLWPTLKGMLSANLSPARADALLAPES